ncbi:MAG TPA: hypothetical protein VM054_04740 [bacterium]|nr:hypothetical protein [bacterium]
MRRFWMLLGLLAVTAVLTTGCVPGDPAALAEAKLLKVDSLELMGKAVEPFTDHETEVEALTTRLKAALADNAAKCCNETLTDQWRILLDTETNQLGAFIERWETKGILGATFIEEAKWVVDKSFDQIINVEEERCK